MLQDSQAAAKFIDTIIDAKLDGGDLDPDIRSTLHQDLLHQLETQIVASLLSLLSEHEQLEFEHLIDSHQVDKVEDYLKRHDININQLLAGVMTDFQAAYLEV